ncbi:hypothetical protein C1H46_025624 [Malus baccata]|uniref:Uncharacterized protein n=1 Tax=Malus baccata TaxID=106549 RepID=A0A540LQN9_MALBA|nr:hypothetical protein C1H46_025624 [Malus baccata]
MSQKYRCSKMTIRCCSQRSTKRDMTLGILLVNYAWRNYPKGCDAYKIYDEKKHMDVASSQHLLNEISDLEAKQEESNPKDDPASNTHVESSVLSKRKEITNGH